MKRALSVALIVFAIIALDQITKYLIVNSLSLYDSIEVFSFLHIVNVRNTGAAFGSFKGLGSSFFIIVAVAAIGFVVYLLMKRTYNTFGLSLILGGAVGNLIDQDTVRTGRGLRRFFDRQLPLACLQCRGLCPDRRHRNHPDDIRLQEIANTSSTSLQNIIRKFVI